MNVNIDCIYYLGFKPCVFHKQDKRSCIGCRDYRSVPGRILIVKLDALGDVLRTTSILPTLVRQYPDYSITWITKRGAVPLLAANPLIGRVLDVEGDYLKYILNENFDIGICLDADPAGATILSLASCGKKFGFVCNKCGRVVSVNKEAEEWYLMGLNDNLKKKNRLNYTEIIHRICCLNYDTAQDIPQFHQDKTSEERARSFALKSGLSSYNKIVGINTGGGRRWECKKWLQEYYVELIRLIKNFDLRIAVLLFGGPDEFEFNQKIVAAVGDLLIDCGCHNSILDFAALVNLCDIFFTPDSLGMHLSITQTKTTLVIVGPTSPWELDVQKNGEVIFDTQLDCIACYHQECPKDKECMRHLPPQLVMDKLKKYLS